LGDIAGRGVVLNSFDGTNPIETEVIARERIFLSPPHLSGREAVLVARAFDSNYIAPVGPMLDEFERDLIREMGVEHCVAVNSGTAALHLALRVAGVGVGDEVWAPTLTFIGGVSPIVFQNARPVFVDCDSHGIIDLDLVEEELANSSKNGRLPKALVVADLYGMCVDIPRARALCDRYKILLVSDSAEAVGSRLRGRASGNGADFVVLSFNGNKIVTTSGGGALLSDNADWIKKARFLSAQASEPGPYYQHNEIGFNYRLSNISAAIGRGQIANLDERVARKREIHEAYRSGLSGLPGISLLQEPPECVSNRWLTVVFIDPAVAGVTPEDVRLALEAINIESRAVWKPMHLQPVFAAERTIGGAVAERLFAQGLCLPSGTAMKAADLNRVISVMRQCLKGVGQGL
jgi:pyridoxal phosphate-dependent aminotransferase EpsN